MRYGISAAALIVQNEQLLLVNHRFDEQHDFWIPPGGKLEGEESIFDCAKREVYEETGLDVTLDRILYIQEFVQSDYHFCKFFILASSVRGKLTLDHLTEDEDFLKEARFFAQPDLQSMDVRPTVLKEQFWHDWTAGAQATHYLGLQRVQG